MISLFSNAYVTYLHTKQTVYKADTVVVSENKVSMVGRKILLQEKNLGSLMPNSMEFFSKLIDRIDKGKSDKIILCLDPSSFQEFIVRWLYSVFWNSDLNTLIEIVKKHAYHEKIRSGGLRFHDADGSDVKYEDIHDLYWGISDGFIEGIHSAGKYFDLNRDLIRSRMSFEYLLGNTFLKDEYSISLLKEKLPSHINSALFHEFKSYRTNVVEKTLLYVAKYEDVGSVISLGKKYYHELTEGNDILGKLLTMKNSDKSIFDDCLIETAKFVGDFTSVTTPICKYIIENGDIPPADVLIEDMVGEDKYEMLYRFYDKNRYNPMWIEFVREKNDQSLLAFGPWRTNAESV